MATTTDPAKTVAANIRKEMVRQRLTIRALADKCGMKHPQIAVILRGEANTGVVTLARIADALDLPLMALLYPVEEEIPVESA